MTSHKRPATSTIVSDIDAAVIATWQREMAVNAVCDDARSWLARFPFTGSEVVYCDPPYLRSVRSSQREYYRHEFATEAEQAELLDIHCRIRARVIVSGYPSELYSKMLSDWRTLTFQTVTRAPWS